MSRWPNAFFAAATLYILIGVTWGLAMSISHDHGTAPAHAHLNLIGWTSMALMGAFYALLGKDTPRMLVAANFVVSNIGVLGMIGGLFLLFTGRGTEQQLAPMLAVGGFSVLGGFVLFAVAVGLSLRKPRAVAAA